jgi:hypothetical protein
MGWNKFIKQALNQYVEQNPLESKFKETYAKLLKITRAYISATPL